MSVRQRDASLLPLVRQATDCVVRKVVADPRYSTEMRAGDINDLIVDSIAACARSVRAMIDAHDRMYGIGSGEAFLLGPYLDVLPSAVVKQVKIKTPALANTGLSANVIGSVSKTQAAATISAVGTPTASPSKPKIAGDTAPAPMVPV